MQKDNTKLTLLMDQFQKYFSPKKYVAFGCLFLKFIARYQTPAETIDQYVNGLKIVGQVCEFVQLDAWQTHHKTTEMTRYLAFERENKNIQQVKSVLSLKMRGKTPVNDTDGLKVGNWNLGKYY